MTSFGSKFRHIYGEKNISVQWTDVKQGTAAVETYVIQNNKKYFTFPWNMGKGSLAIWNLKFKGRLPIGKSNEDNHPNLIHAQNSKILDFKFSPFNDDILATTSREGDVKIWNIKNESEDGKVIKALGLKQYTKMIRHNSLVNGISFHPHAENLLATLGNDKIIKFWDITKGSLDDDEEEDGSVLSINVGMKVGSIAWNENGSNFVALSKDGEIAFVDPRSDKEVKIFKTKFSGIRGMKAFRIPNSSKFIVVGYQKSVKVIELWDSKNMKDCTPIDSFEINDDSISSLISYFNTATNVLFITGKGQQIIQLVEVRAEKTPHISYLTSHRHVEAISGLSRRHQTELNVKNCEIESFYVLSKKSIFVLDFIVPRKSVYFQDDLYSDVYPYGKSTVALKDWINGKDSDDKVKISLCPDGMEKQSKKKVVRFKPKFDSKQELKNSEKKVETLNDVMGSLHYSQFDDDTDSDVEERDTGFTSDEDN